MVLAPPPHYLLDTNVLVHYTRGDALALWIEAQYSLRNLPISPIISIVTVGEIYSFGRQHNWGAGKLRLLRQLLNDTVIVPLTTVGITDTYAEIDAYSSSIGRSMGKNDVWIAATAKVTGAHLLTTDRDFDHLAPVYLQCDWIDPTNKLPGTP